MIYVSEDKKIVEIWVPPWVTVRCGNLVMRLIQMLGATGDCGRREGAQGSGGSCAGAPAQAVDDPGGNSWGSSKPKGWWRWCEGPLCPRRLAALLFVPSTYSPLFQLSRSSVVGKNCDINKIRVDVLGGSKLWIIPLNWIFWCRFKQDAISAHSRFCLRRLPGCGHGVGVHRPALACPHCPEQAGDAEGSVLFWEINNVLELFYP